MNIFMERIVPGSAGAEVRFARRLLRVFGSDELTEEDCFDLNTEKGVKAFQQKCGIAENGEIGAETWKRLAPPLSREYKGWNREKAVKLVQNYLKKLGYLYFKPDGIYGTGTQVAVEAFQAANSLPVNGIWGGECWNIWFLDGYYKQYHVPAAAFMKENMMI